MVVNQCLSRRWADESEDDEDEWTSEAMEELKEGLYPETESLRSVEAFLEDLLGGESRSSWGEDEKENRNEAKVKRARDLLAEVETLTRQELPIEIRARKAAARALLLQYVGDGKPTDLEDAFAEAVKLDPDNLRCWNGAAKALWKKGDLHSAQLCYKKSLENSRDKLTYQNLSMLQRQLAKGKKQEENRRLILESLSNAKSAVALDVQDSHSWYVLGNAYLVLTFSTDGSEERGQLVDKSLKTYKHAMKVHGNGTCSVDLQFNYGVVCKYLERHLEALEAFDYCERVEPELQAGDEIGEIIHKLSQLTTLIGTKCGVKVKRVSKMQEDILAAERRGGSRQFLPLSSLKVGQNPDGVALTCSLVCMVSVKSQVPLMYICMDSHGSFFALAIYGLEESKMPVSHSKTRVLQICGPCLKDVDVTWQGKRFTFSSIRVNRLKSLLVDGKPVVIEEGSSSSKGASSIVVATTTS